MYYTTSEEYRQEFARTENATQYQLSTENPYVFEAVRDIDLVANFGDKPPRVPEGYKEVQYIENPQLTYIDIRNYLSYTAARPWEMIFELLDTTDCNLIGGYYYNSSKDNCSNYLQYRSNENAFTFSQKINGSGTTLKFDSGTGVQTFLYNSANKTATLNEISKTTALGGASLFCCLFAEGGKSPSTSLTGSNFRLYSFKTLYTNMNTLAEFVPAIRESDGAVGLYVLRENTDGTFLTSYITSKNFSAGPFV